MVVVQRLPPWRIVPSAWVRTSLRGSEQDSKMAVHDFLEQDSRLELEWLAVKPGDSGMSTDSSSFFWHGCEQGAKLIFSHTTCGSKRSNWAKIRCQHHGI